MSQTLPTTVRLSNRTDLKSTLLKEIALFEVRTLAQLAAVAYGTNPTGTNIGSLSRCLRSLERKNKLIHSGSYVPKAYQSHLLPNAYWLSEDGARYSAKEWPATYPRHYGPDRSKFTLIHDIERGDEHKAIDEMCGRKNWGLAWTKSDLYKPDLHVKPDDIYEITDTKTAHFIHEKENGKKSFDELFKKFQPYVAMFGSGAAKQHLGFRNFNVTIPMRDEDVCLNLLVHLGGKCNCIDPNARRKHVKAPYKLPSNKLWFTTHDKLISNPEGSIFLTPNDFESRTYSYLDSIQ